MILHVRLTGGWPDGDGSFVILISRLVG